MDRFFAQRPDLKDLPKTYAGRLDPMAEGELLVLIGDECKNKEKYLGLDKEYEFEMLFGFKTDSYDLLGLSSFLGFEKEDILDGLSDELKRFIGRRVQDYPPFSSKTVGGVPLFQKTKNGEVYDSPKREVEIYSIEFLGTREILGEDLLREIKERISLVLGDFRQEDILKKWEENLSDKKDFKFLIAKAKMSCGSGTYVRALVNELKFPATTFSIKRTKIF